MRSKESCNPRCAAPPPALYPVLVFVSRLVRAWNFGPGPVCKPLSPATQRCRVPPASLFGHRQTNRWRKQGDRSRLRRLPSTSPEEDIAFQSGIVGIDSYSPTEASNWSRHAARIWSPHEPRGFGFSGQGAAVGLRQVVEEPPRLATGQGRRNWEVKA
ncbi:hypothetical protein LY76DRAFT_89044 [Colletotrichum caudatum]|nr:hypothetical protein LY76DRAFT_89044 [Colletotrichum caudatum]